jgi:hypothetical protein
MRVMVVVKASKESEAGADRARAGGAAAQADRGAPEVNAAPSAGPRALVVPDRRIIEAPEDPLG